MTDDFNKNSLKILLKNMQSVSLSLQIIKKLINFFTTLSLSPNM